MNKKNSEDRGSKHRRSSVEEPDLNKLSTLSNNPVVWRRTAVGFRIEDIKEKYFDDVIEILKQHYIPTDILCKATKLLEEKKALNSYINRVLQHLGAGNSIMVVYEDVDQLEESVQIRPKANNKIVIAGVLILRIVDKYYYRKIFSRTQLVDGNAMKKCTDLRQHMSKQVDLYSKYNCDRFLRYYDLCIVPSFKNMGLERLMMESGLSVARAAGAPIIMGLFTTKDLQLLAGEIGMEVTYKMSYEKWIDDEGEFLFNKIGLKDLNYVFLAGKVPDPPPTKEIEKPVVEEVPVTKSKK